MPQRKRTKLQIFKEPCFKANPPHLPHTHTPNTPHTQTVKRGPFLLFVMYANNTKQPVLDVCIKRDILCRMLRVENKDQLTDFNPQSGAYAGYIVLTFNWTW